MKSLSMIKNIPYAAILMLIAILGCKPNAENKLNKGIELYKNGEASKAIPYIEDGLIGSALIKELKENHIQFGENALFHRQKKNLKTFWPAELSIEINENYSLISYDPDSKKLGLSNGYDIKIYDPKGSLIKTCGPAPDEKSIKAFTIINEKIYYYKDKKIYFYDMASDAEKILTNDRFPAPFDGESYDVKFYKAENALAAAVGIAGKYNLSVIDLKTSSKVLQNLNIASSKLFFKDDEIYYLSGDAGKYSLIKMSLLSRKTKNLIEFGNLRDIEFFSTGILFENKDGFQAVEYESAYKQGIPFRYELAGQCSGKPVIKYLNIYYIIDKTGFMEKIAYIKEKLPSIFDNTNKK